MGEKRAVERDGISLDVALQVLLEPAVRELRGRRPCIRRIEERGIQWLCALLRSSCVEQRFRQAFRWVQPNCDRGQFPSLQARHC